MIRKSTSSRQAPWLGGLVCGAIAATMPGVALAMAVMFSPVAFVFAMPASRRRAAIQSMALAGLAPAIRPLHELFTDPTLAEATALLSQPTVAITVWAACAGGWLLSETTDALLKLKARATTKRAIKRLQHERQTLQDEWDAGTAV